MPDNIHIADILNFPIPSKDKFELIISWRTAVPITDKELLLNKLLELLDVDGWLVLDGFCIKDFTREQCIQVMAGLKADGHTVSGICTDLS